MAVSRGLLSLLGSPPRGAPRIPGGEIGDRKVGKTFARYDGADVPPTRYFARGGFSREVGAPGVSSPPRIPGGGLSRYAGHAAAPASYFAKGGEAGHSAASAQRSGYFAKGGEMKDPGEDGALSPELKLAAYEILECLNGSNYGPGDKVGKAEAFGKHLLSFFHLAEEMPHEEGPHVDEGGEGEEEEGGEGEE